MQKFIITPLLAGRFCDPTKYLTDRTEFNEQLGEAETGSCPTPRAVRSGVTRLGKVEDHKLFGLALRHPLNQLDRLVIPVKAYRGAPESIEVDHPLSFRMDV